MDLVARGVQEVPAVSEVVASEEAEAVGVSEVVSRVGVEEVVVVALQVETDSRSEGAVDPEADSASREATEAPTATAVEDTMAVRLHRTHRRDLEGAEEAVGMAVTTTEVLVEGTKARPVGMATGAAEAMSVVAAGPEGMIATAVTGVAAAVAVIGMVTVMGLAPAPVLVLVPVLVLALVLVVVLGPEVVEGLVGIEATTIGVVDPMEIGVPTVIGVLMATGVRMVIVAGMIGAAMEVMTGIQESAHTTAATEGMVVAIGTGEGISSVIC